MEEKTVFLLALIACLGLKTSDRTRSDEGECRVAQNLRPVFGQNVLDLESPAVFFLECLPLFQRHLAIEIVSRRIRVDASLKIVVATDVLAVRRQDHREFRSA